MINITPIFIGFSAAKTGEKKKIETIASIKKIPVNHLFLFIITTSSFFYLLLPVSNIYLFRAWCQYYCTLLGTLTNNMPARTATKPVRSLVLIEGEG